MTAGTLSGSGTDIRSSTQLELSVVIVTYNEQDRIRACIESVVAAARELAEFEVILVDSNSTDRTVDIASEYPITIFQIPDDELTTPGAGRYVGTQAARGELVLFVDGDMVLERDWLARAMSLMRSERPGVTHSGRQNTGQHRDTTLPEQTNGSPAQTEQLAVTQADSEPLESAPIAAVDGQLNEPAASGSITTVDSVRGVALYRREILQSVSGFDPYLQSLEDVHLGFELTEAGYRLLRLPEVAATHPKRPSVSEPLRRWRQGYMIGTGQTVRKSLHSPGLLGKHLYRLRHRLAILVWLCVGLGTLLVSSAFLLWLGLSAVAFGVIVTKLGFRAAVGWVVGKLVGIAGLLVGLFVSPQPPEAFPLEQVETLQLGPVQPQTPPVRSDC